MTLNIVKIERQKSNHHHDSSHNKRHEHGIGKKEKEVIENSQGHRVIAQCCPLPTKYLAEDFRELIRVLIKPFTGQLKIGLRQIRGELNRILGEFDGPC